MMMYSPNCVFDAQWAYLCSQEASRQLGEGRGDEAQEKSLAGKQQESQGGNSTKREAFDRLSGIIDTDEARFQKLKQENFKHWEQSVTTLCKGINKGVEMFYQGNLKVLRDILESVVDSRDDYIPQVCEHDFTPHLELVASQSNQFMLMPLTSSKIDASFTDETKLANLRNKLSDCAPLAFWHEPVEMANNGPEFMEGLKIFLLDTARQLASKKANTPASDIETLQKLHSNAIQCLFGVAMLSGNHDLIISVLETMNEYEILIKDDQAFAQAVFGHCQPALSSYLEQLKIVRAQQDPLYHCMQGGNMSGAFGIASQFVQQGMNDRNSSITTDDTYLYLYVSIQTRSFMMKIGTGNNGSDAGRVYLKVDTNDVCDVTWVFCKGKLYSKKQTDPFGLLSVYDPLSLQVEGQVKLSVNECFQNPKLMECLNKNYPLLSDGENLYIVTCQVVQKDKQVRDELRAEFDLLQAKKKLDAKKNAENANKEKNDKAKSEKDKKKEAEDAKKKAAEEKAKADAAAAAEKKKEELKKKKSSRMEKKPSEVKKEEAPKAQVQAELKPYKEIDIYRVCEFAVHQFDVEHSSTSHEFHLASSIPVLSETELHQDPLCQELFMAFSGLFPIKECYRALKLNNDDIEIAVQWIIEEKGKKGKENRLCLNRSQVIYESLVNSYNQVSGTNVEVSVVNSSILQPHNITTGKWTIANGQVAFHNTGQDNEVISVFSLDGSKMTQINKDKMNQTFQIPVNLFEKNDFTQHYHDGKEWKCYTMQQICETIVKIKSLKDLTKQSEVIVEASVQAESDMPEKPEDKSEDKPAEAKTKSAKDFYTAEGFLSELQLYSPIVLHGTLLKHLNAQQSNSQIHLNGDVYITYAPKTKKFYVMTFNGKEKSKNVAVVEDMTNILMAGGEPAAPDALTGFGSFIEHALKQLTYINEHRYQMPWRWRTWSHTLQAAIEHAENYRPVQAQPNKLNLNPLSGLPDDTNNEKANENPESTEAKKTQIKKLRKRLGKIVSRENQIILEQFGLTSLSEREAKDYQAKVDKQKADRTAFLEKQAKQSKKQQPVKEVLTMPTGPPPTLKKQVAAFELEREKLAKPQEDSKRGSYGGLFGKMVADDRPFGVKPPITKCEVCGYNNEGILTCKSCGRVLNSKPSDFKFPPWGEQPKAIPAFPSIPSGQHTLPREHICFARENKKVYAFCPTGSVQTLQSTFKILQGRQNDLVVLRAMLDQVIFADNLAAYHNPQLLDEIYQYLHEQLKSDSCSLAAQQYIWRILIVGWNLFMRSQRQQLQTLILAVNQSRKANVYGETPGELRETLFRVTSTVAPISLFNARFLHHPSFYPIEFMNQSKITAQVVTAISDQVLVPQIKQTTDKSTDKSAEQFAVKPASDQSKAVQITPIKKSYTRSFDSQKVFSSFSSVDVSVTQIPLDTIVMRPAKSSSGSFYGPDSYTFRSQSYFAMPVQTALMSELCQMNIFNDNIPSDLDQVITFYTTEQPPTDHDAKFDFLTQQRETNKKLQDELFKSFMTGILQSLLEQDEAGSEFCWDENVSPDLFTGLAYFIVQSMIAYSWHQPFNTDLMIKSMKFIEDGILLLSKKTQGYTKKFGPHQAKWLNCTQSLAQELVNMLHLSLGYQSQTYLSVKILPSLINILDQFRKIFNVEQSDSKKTRECNMLDYYCLTNTEGIDATHETIWETQHPYPKQDMRQSEVVKVPRAIGYFVEFDPRCSAQPGQTDYVQLKTQDIEYRISDQVGTRFKYFGKSAPGQNVFILIGKQLEIEFRVVAQRPQHGRRPPAEERDRGQQQTQQQQNDQRWGFRLTVLPIFKNPVFYSPLDPMNKSLLPIYNRLDSEAFKPASIHRINQKLVDYMVFFLMTIYVASAFAQDLTDKSVIQQVEFQIEDKQTQINDQFPENGQTQQNSRHSDRDVEPWPKRPAEGEKNARPWTYDNQASSKKKKPTKPSKEEIQLKDIQRSDVLNWHLLKGGLNMQFAKQGAVTDIDQHMQECLNSIHSQGFFRKQLKKFLDDLASSEQSSKAEVNAPEQLKRVPSLIKRQSTIRPPAYKMFESNKDCWSAEVKELIEHYTEEGSILDKALAKTRKLKAYEISFKNQTLRANFKPYIQLWMSVERLLIAAMLYHSDSLGDIKKFLELDLYADEMTKEQTFLKEQFTMIGRQLNLVLTWMFSRLKGQKELMLIVEAIFDRSQGIIKATLDEKERLAREQKQMADEDAFSQQVREFELAEKAKKAEQQEKEKALAEQQKDKAEEAKQSKPKATVTVTKMKAPAAKGKRVNRTQMARALPKPQEKKKKSAVQDKAKADGAKAAAEEEKHPEEVDKIEAVQEVQNEFLDFEGKELEDLKEKIEKVALETMNQELKLDEHQTNYRLSDLAIFFDLELDISDFTLMVNKIFAKVKREIDVVLDLDDPEAAVPKKLTVDKLKFGQPEEHVARDILQRIMLLFEVNNSVNFLSEVTKIDSLQKINTFWRSKRMATILEELEEDQQSQQQIFTELSEGAEFIEVDKLDSDSDEQLMPIDVKRSYSVPTTVSSKFKPPISGLGAPGAQNEKREKALEQRKQSMDYSDWVESYRKWRQWNKKGEDEPELLSPFGSPLLSVVSFGKSYKIQDPSILRSIMIDQQQLAMFRLFGLQMQEKLFHLFGQSAFGKYVWGNQSSTLAESTLNGVETCGERLTKQLNISSRTLVQLLMEQFDLTVKNFLKKERERAALLKEYKRLKTQDEKEALGLTRQNTKAREEAQQAKADMQRRQAVLGEDVGIEDLKKVLLILNDIRVLMNNIYTREHVLESLRQDSQLSTKDSLGVDKIQSFLKSVVNFLMIVSSSSAKVSSSKSGQAILKLIVNIMHVSKLVLNLFISQDKVMIRQTETQRILQEMLLDITVDQLESKCYRVKNGVVESRLTGGQNQGQQMQLLKLLCEVIRISNDTQSAYQADQKDANTENPNTSLGNAPLIKMPSATLISGPNQPNSQLPTIKSRIADENVTSTDEASAEQPQIQAEKTQQQYFLSAGSQKVVRCASLLAYMLHNVEVPQVMRQTIKCASLLFKLLDLRKLNIQSTSAPSIIPSSLEEFISTSIKNEFLVETLKTIGCKIGNVAAVKLDLPIVKDNSVKAQDAEAEAVEDESEARKDQGESTVAAAVTDQEVIEVIDTTTVQPTESKKQERQKSYYVMCNLNTPEQEDFIFVFTALFHWYLRYPNASLKLISDPNEIAQVPKPTPPKQEEKKAEEQKAAPIIVPVNDANKAEEAKKEEKPVDDNNKLPEIIQNKVGDIAKSLQEMFSEQREELSEMDEAKIKEHEKLLMAELAAIEEDAALIEQIELAKKQSLEEMKQGENQEVQPQPKEQEEEKKHEVEVEKAEVVNDAQSSENKPAEEAKSLEPQQPNVQALEVSSEPEPSNEPEGLKIVEEVKAADASSEPAKSSEESKASEPAKVDEPAKSEEVKSEPVSDEKKAEEAKMPEVNKIVEEAKKIKDEINAGLFVRPLEMYEGFMPQILIIQAFFRRKLSAKKPEEVVLSKQQSNEFRIMRLQKMLESIKEIKNSLQLHKELEIQRKELKKLQAIREANSGAKQVPDKVAQAKPGLQPVKSPQRDSLKQRFESLSGGLPEMPHIKLSYLIQAVEAIQKETYKDPFTTDSDEEKKRCMEEKNYYTRLLSILRESIQLAEQLHARNTAMLEGPYSLEKASELADLLQQAYRGQLIPINHNPNMKDDMAAKPVQLVSINDVKKSAKELFPITSAKLEEISKKREKEQTAVQEVIKVAQKNLVVTVMEKAQAVEFVHHVKIRVEEMRAQHRQSRPGLASGGNVTLVGHSSLIQGASQSLIIQELVQLVRSMLSPQDSESANEIQAEFINLFNFTTSQLAKRGWDYEFTETEQYIVMGLLYVFSGWQPQIKTGQLIQVNQNNVWINATVVDEGAGKDKISVILDEDDSLHLNQRRYKIRQQQHVPHIIQKKSQNHTSAVSAKAEQHLDLQMCDSIQIIKINKEKARPINRFELDLEGDLGAKIDQKQLIEAVIEVYRQTKNNDEVVAERQTEYADNSPTTFSKSILSCQNLFLQMLRTCSQLKWTMISQDDPKFSEFIQLMINVSAGQERGSPSADEPLEFEEDKLMAYWERSLIQAWERMIDKSEKRNSRMFVPREFCYAQTNALQRQSTAILKSHGLTKQTKEIASSQVGLANEAEFSPQQFMQTQNTFLSGLPQVAQKQTLELQNLKRLQYWERQVVPHLIRFCTGYYKAWEWNMYFGQLRNHLSTGSIELAHDDAMMMFNRNPPANCFIPDVEFDWSHKIVDEVLSDTWAIAKISPQGSKSAKQTKNQSSANQIKSNIPILDRLLNLEIDEILVHIKAVDGKSNSVYAQYFDSDCMTTSFFWIPISNLVDLSKPLPPRSIGFSNRKLAVDFENSIQRISQIYSRQTLIKLFQDFQFQQQSLQSQQPRGQIVSMPTQNLRLQELICWSIWENFCNEPIDGWLKQVNPVIMLDSSTRDQKEATSNDTYVSLQTILEQTLDKIAKEEITKSKEKAMKKHKEENQGSTETTLSLVRDILSDVAARQVDGEKADSLFTELVDWCVTSWYEISGLIGKSRACLELMEEYRKYKRSTNSDNSASQSLPLHNLVPGKGANANATLILFKKNKVKLTPGSKVMLFSDAEKTDLLEEISAQGQQQAGLEPLILAKGKVWIEFEEGSNCLVPIEQRNSEKSSIECAVFHIPKEWAVVCWLTEVITTILIKSSMKNAPNFVIEVFSKLIGAIQVFYDESRAPSFLKTTILKLMSRLIIKLRIVYIEIERQNRKSGKSVDIQSSDHFKRCFVTSEFVQTLLSEMLVQMDTKACNALNDGQPEKPVPEGLFDVMEFQSKDKILHPHFAQEAIEFLMHLVIPTSRKLQLQSYRDLLPSKEGSSEKAFTMPLWIEPLLKASSFLHYLRGQAALPKELQKKIYSQTKLGDANLDNVILLLGLPANDPVYTKVWIRDRILELVAKHRARILEPVHDITFVASLDDPETFNAVIVLDGFSHMRLIDDGENEDKEELQRKHKIELLFCDSDEEDDTAKEEAAKKEQERKKREEEEMPKEWACGACTCFNPMGAKKCGVCETPAPPMEDIIAEHKEKLNAERQQKGEVVVEIKTEVVPLHMKRLSMLQSDLRHMISHEQRLKLLADIAEKKAREEKEAAEKAALKAEEEAKHAKEQEKKVETENLSQGLLALNNDQFKQFLNEAEDEKGKLKIEDYPEAQKLISRLPELKDDVRAKWLVITDKILGKAPVAKPADYSLFPEVHCKDDHLIKYRTSPKERGAFSSGKFVNCDICRNSINNIADGYYTCDQSCDWDCCKECYKKAMDDLIAKAIPKHQPVAVEKPKEEVIVEVKEEKKAEQPPQRRNSFASESHDSNWEDEHSGNEEEKEIDLDNLPDDQYERFRILGIDTFALDEGDNDMARMMEESAIDELRRTQERKKAEREEKKKAADEEKKRKQREAEKAALSNANTDVKLVKIETLIGQKAVFTHDKACIIAQDVLRSRLTERPSLVDFNFDNLIKSDIHQSEGFKFSPKVVAIIKQIHQNFKKLPIEDLQLPENEPLLSDFEITKSFLKDEEDFETVLGIFSTLADADVRLLYKVFESQGYDVQLTQAVLPSYNLQSMLATQTVSRSLNKLATQTLVKRLIEQDYCDLGAMVVHANPSEVRLLQKYEAIVEDLKVYEKKYSKPAAEDASEVKSESKVPEDQPQLLHNYDKVHPVGYFDDKACESRYKEIYNELSMAEIRYVWALLKTFNEFYVPAVPIINQRQSFIDVPSNAIPLNIGLYMKDLRDLSLSCVKTNLRCLILDQTSVDVENPPLIYVNKLKTAAIDEAQADSAKKVVDAPNEEKSANNNAGTKEFMFIRAYEQLRDVGLYMFRPRRPKGNEPHIAFEVVMSNEDVVGWGGPYKSFFSSISQEIQPSKLESKLEENLLGLMCPSANQRDKEQFGGDKFVLTSSDLTQRKLQYFEFLGIIMGIAIRTGIHLVLDLPAIFWKNLIGANPTTIDIHQIEQRFFNKMNMILKQTKEEEVEPYYWTVMLADGKEFDLTTDGTGREKEVSFDERIEYVRRCIYTKLTESSVQCAAVRRGLVKIIPESILNQISWEEMESWVCGQKYIDVDLIQRNTKLVGFMPDDELIVNFWQLFESLNQQDRRSFVKFVYAIERLPVTDEDWKRMKLEFAIHELKKTNKKGEPVQPDDLLPEASTCFNQLKLPRYTSKEKMRKQIICAFTNDNESMNAEHDQLAREMRREHVEDRRNSYDDQSDQEE